MNKHTLKTLKKYYPVKHIIGKIGVFVEGEIVYTYGPMLLHWNYQTDQMDGFDLFWMVN